MRSSAFRPFAFLALLAFSFSSSSHTGAVVSAQSTNCHSCILKAIPTITNCTTLTTAQLNTLDQVILGQNAFSSPDSYKTQDATGFNCLTALMWDIVEYKAQLWGHCLDPTSSCPWTEMMQWLEMIPMIAAVYGSPSPPAQLLKDGPA
ncbi:hypothetical protein BGZ99_002493 [Dissophora globulifera]|uniref:Uncharacterized protein n=1 Tax=Dissophora globulifera TaxID=979702 RepID=A0A9P6UXH9_9FUNG|nr:hypothetical protein BGZ99_002493 [Dissophora globulifera]